MDQLSSVAGPELISPFMKLTCPALSFALSVAPMLDWRKLGRPAISSPSTFHCPAIAVRSTELWVSGLV